MAGEARSLPSPGGPRRSRAPHVARERCRCVLLLIDVINDLSFDGADLLSPRARRMAPALERLKARAGRAGIPSVYVNDNFGRWRSDFRSQVRHCLREGAPGRDLAERLVPGEADYFVLKPLHSGFYSTALETLLEHLGAETLVLTGLTTDNCALATAYDAYIRGFRIFVPSDCAAAQTAEQHRNALGLMSKNLKADTRPSTRLVLGRLASGRGQGRAA